MFSEKQIEKMIEEGHKSPEFKEYLVQNITGNDGYAISFDKELEANRLYQISLFSVNDDDTVLTALGTPSFTAPVLGYNPLADEVISIEFYAESMNTPIQLVDASEYVLTILVLE